MVILNAILQVIVYQLVTKLVLKAVFLCGLVKNLDKMC